MAAIFKIAESDTTLRRDSYLLLRWKKGTDGQVTALIPDPEFNEKKGDLESLEPDRTEGDWRIRVKEIGHRHLKYAFRVNRGTVTGAGRLVVPGRRFILP